MKYGLLLITLIGLALAGCDGEAKAAKPGCDLAQAAALEAAGQSPQSVGSKLHRVVFIGLEEACGCTRDRIDATWEALDAALLERPDVMVERIFGDTQEDQAAPYIAMKALVVAPGVYFLDAEDGLLEMMQGKLSAEQLVGAVK